MAERSIRIWGQAEDAYRQGNFSLAAKLYEQSCNDENNSLSCERLARMYFSGEGVQENNTKSIKFLEKSCNLQLQENADRKLGDIGSTCTKVARRYYYHHHDIPAAIRILNKACNANHRDGHECVWFNIKASNLYARGNYTDAAKFYEAGCNIGYKKNSHEATNCFNLGLLYRKGQGVKQNDAQAAKFFEQACNGGVADGCYNLGASYYNGQGKRQNFSTAKEYYGKACDLGDQGGCDEYKKLNIQGY